MPELAVIAGTDPVIVDSPKAFVQVSWEDIAAADPDIVVITPCGYTVERTLEEMQDREVQSGLNAIRAVHAGKCVVTDGNAYFNRPGPRLADSAEILAAIAHPDAVPDWVERFASAISRKSPATS
jgi:iron complex transport system substrate-binding protein